MKSINEYLNDKNNDIKVIRRKTYSDDGTVYTQYIDANLTQDELDKFNEFLEELKNKNNNYKLYLNALNLGENYTTLSQSDNFIKYFNLNDKYLRKNTVININKK